MYFATQCDLACVQCGDGVFVTDWVVLTNRQLEQKNVVMRFLCDAVLLHVQPLPSV